jgi:hypothetical protein
MARAAYGPAAVRRFSFRGFGRFRTGVWPELTIPNWDAAKYSTIFMCSMRSQIGAFLAHLGGLNWVSRGRLRELN